MLIRRVVGNSMKPTLFEGDIIIARKKKKIARDDIVIARYEGREIIKRVKKITKGKYYLVGDNKNASTDSRKFGPINRKDILAVAFFVVGASRFPRWSKLSKSRIIVLATVVAILAISTGLVLYKSYAKSENGSAEIGVPPVTRRVITAQYPVNTMKKDIPYCNGQALDIYYPTKVKSEVAPVVMYIHGGGWENNTKSSETDQISIISGLRDEGYAIVSIDYRRLPENSFPDPVNDALCSVRFLRAEHKQLGIDSNKIAVFGFSAGGHLAAMIGTLDSKNQFNLGPYENESSRVNVVVVLAGLFDFENGLRYNNTLRIRYFLKGADRKIAEPINYVSSDDPPVLMIHGNQDQFVPPEQDDLFGAKLKEAGVKYRIVHIDNAEHGLGEVGGTRSMTMEQVSGIIKNYINDNISK